jgi:c-di-GMP-binding flagellar brake protein YcgR
MKGIGRLPEFTIEIGAPLLLSVSGKRRGFKGSIVGCKPKEYIIIEMLQGVGSDSKIAAGSMIDGTFISSGAVILFKSSVLNYIEKPKRLIVASFPEFLESRELRKSQRAECSIPAILKLYTNMSQFSGIIMDISGGGCKYRLDPDATGTVMLSVKLQGLLMFELSGIKKRQILDCEIVHVDRKGQHVELGLKFTGKKEELKEVDEWISMSNPPL